MTGKETLFPTVCKLLRLLMFLLLRSWSRSRGEDTKKEGNGRTNERTKEGEMAPALINANPVVHERKERPLRSQPDYNDAVADVIDAQEIFDILPFVVRKKDGFASLFAVVVVR